MDSMESSCCVPGNIQKSFIFGSAVGLLGIVIYQVVKKKELDKSPLQENGDNEACSESSANDGSSSEKEDYTNAMHTLSPTNNISAETLFGVPYYEELKKEHDSLKYTGNSAKTKKLRWDVTGGSNNPENFNYRGHALARSNSKIHVRTMVEYFERCGASKKN